MKVVAAHVKLNDYLNSLGHNIDIRGVHSAPALGLVH